MPEDIDSQFLDRRCDEWRENHEHWNFQWDHYDAKRLFSHVISYAHNFATAYRRHVRDSDAKQFHISDISRNTDGTINLKTREGSPDPNISPDLFESPWKIYLPKAPGESIGKYVDRARTTDYTPHMQKIISVYVGNISGVEEKSNRIWQEEGTRKGLKGGSRYGDVAGRLQKDCDGTATSWKDKWEEILTKTLIFDKGYVMVERPRNENGTPKIKYVDPRSVVNKRYINGKLKQLLVKEEVNYQNDLRLENKTREEYILYSPEGWSRWTKDDNGDAVRVTNENGEPIMGEYQYYDGDDKDAERTIPIAEVTPPMVFGYLLAVKNNRIFQKQSERDHKLRTMRNTVFGIDADDEQFENAARSMYSGESKMIQGKPIFANPSGEPVVVGSETIEKLAIDMYSSFHLQYGDRGRERTAREVDQDFKEGLMSVLTMLTTTLDRVETKVLRLIEQTLFPDDPNAWGQAEITRSTDFEPINRVAEAKELKNTFFDMKDMELPESAEANIVKRILDLHNIEYEEEEVSQKVDEANLTRLQEDQGIEEEDPLEGLETEE